MIRQQASISERLPETLRVSKRAGVKTSKRFNLPAGRQVPRGLPRVNTYLFYAEKQLQLLKLTSKILVLIENHK